MVRVACEPCMKIRSEWQLMSRWQSIEPPKPSGVPIDVSITFMLLIGFLSHLPSPASSVWFSYYLHAHPCGLQLIQPER